MEERPGRTSADTLYEHRGESGQSHQHGIDREGPMKRRAVRLAWSAPWALFGLTVALLAFTLVLRLVGGAGQRAPDPFFLVPVGFAGVGALVAARTSNRVGWLCLAEGLALALPAGTNDYA